MPAPKPWSARIVGVLFFLLVLTTFFYRGPLVGSIAGSSLIPVAAVALGAFLLVPPLWERGTFTLVPPAATAFALAVLVNVLANATLHPSHSGVIVRFGLEMVLNLLMYYVAVAYMTSQQQPMTGMCRALILAAAPMIVAISVLASALASIRRVGGSEMIGTAVNHLAHALVVAVVAAHYLTMRVGAGRGTRIFAGLMLIFSVLGVILTGSRASMAALLLFTVALVGIASRRLRVSLVAWVGAAGVALVFGVIAAGERVGPLVRRFSLDVIRDAVLLRVDVMLNAFNDLRVLDLLLGVPWRYQPLAPLDPVVYPHNFGLSMLLHVGLLPFAFLTHLILSRLWRLTRAALTDVEWREPFALASILAVTVLYASTSGRLTRILTVFFALGVADGWLFHRRLAPGADASLAGGYIRDTKETPHS